MDMPEAATNFSEGPEVYQSVSRAAITSVLLGVVGLTSFWLSFMLLLPVLGLLFGIIALRSFRLFPDELVGRPLAYVGAALSGILLVAAPAYHTVIYMTEVPDGYTRADFAQMRSSDENGGPPMYAIDLNGKKVFIKGYIHPTSMDTLKSKRFVLVPDLGTCCFGGQPPLTHMIEVSLQGDQYATKSYRQQRLAGKLSVNPQLKPVDGLTGVYYQLRADILK